MYEYFEELDEMNWSARGNVLNQYLRNTSIGTTARNIYRGIGTIKRQGEQTCTKGTSIEGVTSKNRIQRGSKIFISKGDYEGTPQ